MKRLIMLSAAGSAMIASAAVTITDVSARQRWPWNNLVDVDFSINGAATGEAFAIDITAEYGGGKISAFTYMSEPVVGGGSHRLVWNMGKDYPDFHAEDMRISVIATPFSDSTPVYMVVDLAGGKDATSYPVRYTTSAPAHVQGAVDEPCQTTELWFRRISARNQTFVVAGSAAPSSDNSNWFTKLTNDFYIAIFETTQQQWFQITGTWPSSFSNETFRASRPFDSYYTKMLFGDNGCEWSDGNQTIDGSCLLQALRNRTGLQTLNLPTEAQWQFAACAGTMTTPTKTLSNVSIYNGYSRDEVARYGLGRSGAVYADGLCGTNYGTACVGSYKPNLFGLYDMIGNVTEDCTDRYVEKSTLKQYYIDQGYQFPIVEPQGLAPETATSLNDNKARIVTRGGSYVHNASYNDLWYRSVQAVQHYSVEGFPKYRGFRFCVTCK